MRLPSWPTLIAAAGGGGVGLGLMMLLTNRQRDKLANKATFLQRAIDIAKEQPKVRELLGEEIQVGKITLNDGWGKLQRLHVQLKVPVKGEHDFAYLYAYARRKSDEDKLKLYKLEATFNKIAGKKLIIMDRTNEEDNGDDDEDKEPEASKPKESKANNNVANDKQKLEPPKTKEEMKEAMKSWSWR